MSNSYFQFKQFRIEQQGCAMKVTTDACILGAWCPIENGVRKVLDIGAGTGLLATMLAQRSDAIIVDAVEYDAEAAEQAAENAAASPWSGRINVIHADARSYTGAHKYDLIITNPPFFNDSLLSDKQQKNVARHTLSLSYAELLCVVNANLADDGYAAILLPVPEYERWKLLAISEGWDEVGALHVRHRDSAAVKRVVGLFSRRATSLPRNALTIQDDGGNYSVDFKQLLGPFYLNL
ncbi:MAG: methyltransferase [Bacteroidota bacterium]